MHITNFAAHAHSILNFKYYKLINNNNNSYIPSAIIKHFL